MIGSYANMVSGDINNSIRRVIEKGGDCTMVCAQPPMKPNFKERNYSKRDKDLLEHEVIVHAPFSINLASDNETLGDFSVQILKAEVLNTEKLDSKYLVIHPGNALKQNRDYCLGVIASRLMRVIELTPESDVVILLETMAGKGTELGCTLEEIEKIVNNCKRHPRIGICLDTCHLHDGGYELNSGFMDYLKDMDLIDLVKCVHVNGSKNTRGSRKDRHAGVLDADNHINKEVLYNFVKYFHDKGIACVSEKEIGDITEDIYYLRNGAL